MANQAQDPLSQRWTQMISLRPAPIVPLFQAFILGLSFYGVFAWHASLLILTLFFLWFKSNYLSENTRQLGRQTRLRFGPGVWRWQTGTQTQYFYLLQASRGPYWYYITLAGTDGQTRQLCLWRFTMSKTAWRRLTVLLQAKRWQQTTKVA